jgi:YebC/PmpR family DNA-binding regulatory protein
MSGHSKWSTIKRKKGAADAKRGKIFTKLIRELSSAAQVGGGDPDANPRLRLAVEKARAANMPKDNIERAIKKGSGESDAQRFEEVVYEGYGPGGVAIYVEALTDNRKRTVSDLRHALTKHGGNLGSTGCVSYLFEKRGLLYFDRRATDGDALLEAALEVGAEDVIESDDLIQVTTAPGALDAVRRELTERSFKPAEASVSMEPTTTVALSGDEARSMLALADSLEDLDDVQNVYANFDISEEEMSKFA